MEPGLSKAYLPPEEDRAWLIDALRSLIDRRGAAHFLDAPLVEPNDTYFPDAYTPDPRGVYLVAQRLLRCAGLGDFEPEIAVVVRGAEAIPHHQDARGAPSIHRGATAWFLGLDDDHCCFAVRGDRMHDGEQIVAALAHEVAHAYRAHHGLDDGGDLEERLTELTGVYLGFGVLSTNARLGYLPPEALAFAFAAQVSVRGIEGGEVRRIASLLQTHEAAHFEEAIAHFEKEPLAWSLVREADAAVPTLEAIAQPIEDVPDFGDPRDLPPELRPPPERPIFRVRAHRTTQWALLGAVLTFALLVSAALVNRAVQGKNKPLLRLPIPHAVVRLIPWSLIVAGGIAGGWYGRKRRADRCSDPRCGARIALSAETCPRCGGRVMGELEHEDDRLEAEEKLRKR